MLEELRFRFKFGHRCRLFPDVGVCGIRGVGVEVGYDLVRPSEDKVLVFFCADERFVDLPFIARDPEDEFEAYLPENATAAIVVSHGFTESAEKFREMAYYYAKAGYLVFAIDHRGHGYSHRENPQDPETVHIDNFDTYIEDLKLFVDTVVKPQAGELPLYLYGHSMGGAVALFYLAAHPDVFRKAVLSAPLFVPHLPAPMPLAALSAWYDTLARGPKSKLTHSSDFVPVIPPEWENDPQCSRNLYMLQLRLVDPAYRTTPMTRLDKLAGLHIASTEDGNNYIGDKIASSSFYRAQFGLN
ncbi:MAG: alpha/beta fold hydrolase [Christensenellaceae bacterium]|nr:alpha/beta fold hydrolase [Christensenellaceae bacterium]